ncbi:MAG: hypothetical protein JWL61_3320 [Gemmatimonadetes bacterium]|nr:hypothetical protein [Gemmatimonadota bacterium]
MTTSSTHRFGSFEQPLSSRYRVEAELGRGAMGTVYRARDLQLDRDVAMKVLHVSLTNDVGILRFQSEIRIAAGLHHPNIIGVFDSGTTDGRLFYVMEYLGGESLRQALQREKQLSVERALEITEQVASALQFAHDAGVVHRDVKPENIILTDGGARVVDFGLARMLSDIDAQRLTASGVSVGTPLYLSPEQASAERSVGPASDQYALACVLYEMLVGEPPFTGPTASAIAMRHIVEPPPPLNARRRAAPAAVHVAAMRALEKVPNDRYQSIRLFADALRVQKAPRSFNWRLVLGLITISVVVALSVAVYVRTSVGCWLPRCVDDSRYIVFPFRSSQGDSNDLALNRRLISSMSHWQGVTLPSDRDVQNALEGHNSASLGADDGRVIARTLGAGTFVLGSVTREASGVRINLTRYDALNRRPAQTISTVAPAELSTSDSIVGDLAYSLLFGEEERRYQPAARGTRNFAAFNAFLQGRHATRRWNLPVADSSFARALALDHDFAEAALALAEVRHWAADNRPDVEDYVTRSMRAPTLSANDRRRAAALLDLVRGKFESACPQFDSLSTHDSLDFGAWYGVSECNRLDRTVLPDARSPSGLRFRGSAHSAGEAIRRAFATLDSVDVCCAARADLLLRRVLNTDMLAIHFGFAAGSDAIEYGAYPQLLDDTLAFVPRPMSELNKAPPATHPAAIERERKTFYDLATRRVTRFPNNADALEELGLAMTNLGHEAAADTIHRAFVLSTNSHQRLQLAVSEFWLRVKAAIPNRPQDLRLARAFGDSLLRHSIDAPVPEDTLLASVAAALGDAHSAARMMARAVDVHDANFPPTVQSLGNMLAVYAAVGGPIDSVRSLEKSVENAIASQVVPAKQDFARTMLLVHSLEPAFPLYESPSITAVRDIGGIAAAEAAFARKDVTTTKRLLTASAQARMGMRASDLTIDRLYCEAWLWAQIGDTARALRTLNPTLDLLRYSPPRQFYIPVQAAMLVRAMGLRAELMRSTDAAGAQRWASAVAALREASASARQQGPR